MLIKAYANPSSGGRSTGTQNTGNALRRAANATTRASRRANATTSARRQNRANTAGGGGARA